MKTKMKLLITKVEINFTRYENPQKNSVRRKFRERKLPGSENFARQNNWRLNCLEQIYKNRNALVLRRTNYIESHHTKN